MMQLDVICRKAADGIRAIGQWQLAEQHKVRATDVELKDHNSLVSYVDRESERRLAEHLRRLWPGCGFLTEEETVDQRACDVRWIIDPLDGTTNYLHGLPCFAISVALQVADQLVAGIIYDPPHDELFVAWQGGGAWCNGRPIRVRANARLADALLATGFPYHDYTFMEHYLGVFRHFMHHTRGLRRWGAAAVDLAWTACGRYDGFFEYSLNPWDVAAGIVLVRAAGGVVTDFSGGDGALHGRQILAASPAIHAAMLEVIGPAFAAKEAGE